MPPKKFKQMNTKSNSSDKVDRKAAKSGQRTKATIQRLNMYKGGKAIRDRDGKVIGGSLMMKNKAGGEDIGNMARIAPDRRWFGNTRTISQNELEKFKEEMTTKDADPYSVVLRRKKIPMALLQDSEKMKKVNILETESYNSVFGGNKARKRPKLDTSTSDMAALMLNAEKRGDMYSNNSTADCNIEVDNGGELVKKKAEMFSKGQSKRIWAELYKVLDCSDVVLQIIDARNVPGTRSLHIEQHIKKNASHKHLVIVLNKCDLVPSWVARKWVKILSKDFPTLAFHASLTNAFGKGALISLLRQFAKLHAVSNCFFLCCNVL
jgi:nuclear GTP-binding protein